MIIQPRARTHVHILFLLIFLGVTLFINLFHTEHTIEASNACPACHFQNSSLTTPQIPFFHLPQLSLLEALKTAEPALYHQIFLIIPSNRSPPQA